jgi:hypothetical protein
MGGTVEHFQTYHLTRRWHDSYVYARIDFNAHRRYGCPDAGIESVSLWVILRSDVLLF